MSHSLVGNAYISREYRLWIHKAHGDEWDELLFFSNVLLFTDFIIYMREWKRNKIMQCIYHSHYSLPQKTCKDLIIIMLIQDII